MQGAVPAGTRRFWDSWRIAGGRVGNENPNRDQTGPEDADQPRSVGPAGSGMQYPPQAGRVRNVQRPGDYEVGDLNSAPLTLAQQAERMNPVEASAGVVLDEDHDHEQRPGRDSARQQSPGHVSLPARRFSGAHSISHGASGAGEPGQRQPIR